MLSVVYIDAKINCVGFKNTHSNVQFFLIKLRTKLTCRTDYDYVKISETHEERQNKRGQKSKF